VQVGITSIGVLNGIVGEAAFSEGVAHWLHTMGVAEKAAAISATALVVTLITFTTIIFGELVPKRIGQLHPEQVSRWVARPMLWLARVAGPFVKLLSGTTAAVLRLLRIDTNASHAMTEEEITASLEEGVDAGVIEEHEHQMVQNVFGLDDRPLTSLMVPRSDVDWLDAGYTVAQSLQKVGSDGAHRAHSWYPVCRGSMDDVVGKISLAHLLELGAQAPGVIEDFVSPASFVPETLSGMELLEQFRAKVSRQVLVVDEYGVVQGLLTPHDLLEAITGELQPGAKTEAWATERDDGSWLLDGLMPVSELKARLDIDDLPDEDRGRYNTVAGLLMAVSGHLPVTGEKITCEGWLFEVVDLDGKRVDKVLASQITA
jgi:putative hemolysin